mmetsp:Transcript_60430/g.153563  ORF Transcript_60430/g.153563 Transcript_60430/m.153563 type:complete len:87 (+) Transcript_60430:66-326(+)
MQELGTDDAKELSKFTVPTRMPSVSGQKSKIRQIAAAVHRSPFIMRSKHRGHLQSARDHSYLECLQESGFKETGAFDFSGTEPFHQ